MFRIELVWLVAGRFAARAADDGAHLTVPLEFGSEQAFKFGLVALRVGARRGL